MKKSRIAYIEPNDAGRPCMPLRQLLEDVAFDAHLDRLTQAYTGLTNRPGKNRRKVRVTVTVEAVE